MELLALIAAAVLMFQLARKLCGDPYGAALASVVYVFSPAVRTLAAESVNLAFCLPLLPLLFLLFYRTNDIARDAPGYRRKLHIAALTLCLGTGGALDSRFALTAGLLVWIVLLLGYLMDRRRRGETWGPPFAAWAAATVGGIALYAPLWWWHRMHPASAAVLTTGADFMQLWQPSPYYVGMAAFGMATGALILAQSYQSQARLWFMAAGLMLWLTIGLRLHVAGHALWWVPALYRGLIKIPLYAGVDPYFFAAAGQFTFALLTAFGFGALLTRAHPTQLRWLRPALCAFIALTLLGDGLRFLPFLP
ncbi:MAG: hypothetical protein ABIJ96_02565 [Elusimicrobiota bacterium]